MTSKPDTPRPDPAHWAFKLHEAAAELRLHAGQTPNSLSLASRLERYAEAILFPQLPRWWADPHRDRMIGAAGGDD